MSNYENYTLETLDSYRYMKCMIVSMYIDIFIYNLGHVLLPKNGGLNTTLKLVIQRPYVSHDIRHITCIVYML